MHRPQVWRATISVALIALLSTRVDWHAMREVFVRADRARLALIALVSPLLIASLALRLQILLRVQRVKMSYLTVVQVTWAGQFFNTFLPGTTGGDVFKLYEITRLAKSNATGAASAVVLDRIMALIALLILAGMAFALQPQVALEVLGNGASLNRRFLGAGMALLVVAGVVFSLRKEIAARFGAAARILYWVTNVFQRTKSHLRFTPPNFLALGVALVTHLSNFCIVYFIAQGLHIDLSLRQTIAMMPLVLFVVLLPLTINGHGLREVIMIAYFSFEAVGGDPTLYKQRAVALSLAFVANDFWTALPGGLWYLTDRSRRAAAESRRRHQAQ